MKLTEFLTLNESSLSRLWSKYKQFDSGTITAFRGERTKSENMSLNAKLKSQLLGGGYSVTPVNGVYIEQYGTPNAKRVSEKAFIVFDQKGSGNLLRDLKKLGELYDQDSITFCDAKTGKYILVGTSKRDDSYPGYGKSVTLGKSMFGKNGEFYSSVNGRPFVFSESVVDDSHGYDDVSEKYSTTHRGMLSREYKKILSDDNSEN